MELLVSLGFAFVVLAALAIWMAIEAGKLRKQVAERDDLITDLRSALGGADDKPDWRNAVL